LRSEGRKIAAAKKRGRGGNSFSPHPFFFPQKSFLHIFYFAAARFFLLKGKENFFAGQRAKRAAVGRSKFAVRIFVKKSSDFVQKVPPIFKIRILGDCCLAPPKAGLGKSNDFIWIFEIQKQFLPAQTEVRFAEGKHKFEKFINQSFFFRF